MEICERDQRKAKDIETIEKESGTEEPVPDPLPTPEPEVNQVLRVHHQEGPKDPEPVPSRNGPRVFNDSSGRKQVTWTERV